jgi:hypothetical protein
LNVDLVIFAIGIVFSAGINVGTAIWVVSAVKDHEKRIRRLELSDAARVGSEEARLHRVHHPAL